MNELRRLWREHLKAGFPDEYRGKEIAGVDLILLDADIVGCVSASFGNPGLDPQRADILQRCYLDVAVVTQALTGPARDYFARLERMASIMLKRSNRPLERTGFAGRSAPVVRHTSDQA